MTVQTPHPDQPDGGPLQRLRKHLSGQRFVKQVATLMSGTIGGQLLLFAVSPILTRIFTPADFATFALFAAASNVFAVVLPGRYDFAIMLEDDDVAALHVTLAALTLTVIGTALLQVGSLTMGPQVLTALSIPDEQGWLVYFPVGAGLWATFDIVNRWHAREKMFGRMAAATVSYSGSMAATQISAILLIPGMRGLALILGQVVGRASAVSILVKTFAARVYHHRSQLRVASIRGALSRHWRFPAFSVASGLLSRLRNALPAFMIPVFGTNVLGWYALCNRVLATPITLMGGAVSQVFFPRIAEIRHRPAETRRLLIRAYTTLSALIIAPVVVLFFWAEPLFGWVFGDEWLEAGRYARLMLPLMAIRFVIAPTGLSMQAFERQLEVLVWIIAYLGLTFGILYWGTHESNAETTIAAYAWGSASMYLIYLVMSIYFSGKTPARDPEAPPAQSS